MITLHHARPGSIAGAMSLLVSVSTAHAGGAERYWECDLGGTFDDITCWQDFIAPGTDDTAIFDTGGLYTVEFPSTQVNDRLVVRSGFITFDLDFGSYILSNPLFSTPSIVIGDVGPANAALTVVGSGFSGKTVTLGRQSGALGSLTVHPAPDDLFANFGADFMLQVGGEGTGLLEVTAADDQLQFVNTNETVVGLGSGSTGLVTLSGPVALDASFGLTVGQGGFAALTAEAGATLDSSAGIIGQQAGSLGTTTITGFGSDWDIAGSLDVGFFGQGFLTIEDGATVTNDLFAAIGTSAGSDPFENPQFGSGMVSVDGAGSLWTINGDLHVGLFGVGHLACKRGGQVVVEGDLLRGDAGPNEIQFTLSSSTDYQTAAISVGGLTDDFDATVTIEGDTVALTGDSYILVVADLLLGEFDLDLPELPKPRQWLVLQDDQVLELRVIDMGDWDLNGDGVVDVSDLVIVINDWGVCPVPPGACPGDGNGDGVVDVVDLLGVIQNWSA